MFLFFCDILSLFLMRLSAGGNDAFSEDGWPGFSRRCALAEAKVIRRESLITAIPVTAGELLRENRGRFLRLFRICRVRPVTSP